MTSSYPSLGRLLALIALLACSAGGTARLGAVEPKDAVPTDPDFKIQGEYVGQVTTKDGQKAVGVQVIALGQGKFQAVGCIGGLPGDGWDKTAKKTADGELKDGAVEFKGQEYNGTLKDGVLAITMTGGIKIGELKKVDRASPTLGAKPPAGAIVLFDGTNPDQFEGGRITEDGLLVQGARASPSFVAGRCTLSFARRSCPTRGTGPRQQRLLSARPLRDAGARFVRPGRRGQRVRRHLLDQGSGREHVLSAAGLANLRHRLH